MLCHSANLVIEVEDAAGRITGEIADEIVADTETSVPGIQIERTKRMIAGEEAVVLEGLPEVTSSGNIYIVHADRLYELVLLPWSEKDVEFARNETLFNTFIDTSTFLNPSR